MSVEVAAGAVVVLGRARVGVPSEDLRVAEGYAGVQGVVIAAWRSEWGLMWRGMPTVLAMRTTIR